MLGKQQEARIWRDKAAQTKSAMLEYLYDKEDQFFYDRDTRGFRKYRSEHITRVFLNKVLGQDEFEPIYARYFEQSGKEFLPPFPFPSMSIDDPHFNKECPKNSWGSNTQALTGLRATMWMDYYRRSEDLNGLLSLWMKAFLKYDSQFPQEINPFDGHPVGNNGKYTPSLIIFIKAAERLFR